MKRVALGAFLLAAGVMALGAGASHPLVLSEKGVGGLQLGRSLAQIQSLHLIGAIRMGCDLSSTPSYNASLEAPFAGDATFDGNKPTSRLVALSITGGAVTNRGVAIGSSAAAVKHAYPTAKVQDSPPPNALVFYALAVQKGNKDLLWFLLDHHGGKVELFDVPVPQFCD